MYIWFDFNRGEEKNVFLKLKFLKMGEFVLIVFLFYFYFVFNFGFLVWICLISFFGFVVIKIEVMLIEFEEC